MCQPWAKSLTVPAVTGVDPPAVTEIALALSPIDTENPWPPATSPYWNRVKPPLQQP